MAYFIDPMGDEFKKAIEAAMKEIEDEEAKHTEKKSGSSRSAKKQIRKSQSRGSSRSVKRSLR